MPHSLTITKVEGKPGQVYYPLQLNQVPKPKPGPREVLVRLHAASLNHRDFFIRQHLYPGISFDHPLLSDGCGTVVEAGSEVPNGLVGKRVILTPIRNWDAAPDGPEDSSKFGAIGGSTVSPAGTAQDYVSVPSSDVVLAPPHLTVHEAAALPLVGLTAWRALSTKILNGDLKSAAGRNILITGIGGGVALSALQFASALGANVYVTSSNPTKLEQAQALGAKGGVSYRDATWDKQLATLLPPSRPYLDAVIDGAGGDVVTRTTRLLRAGGIIAVYGMTVGPKMDWSMTAVLKNVELKGTTMGSRAEFQAMVDFVREHQIRPVVSRITRGGLGDIAAVDGLFEDMRHGRQFGKLVVEISAPDDEGSPKL